MGTRANPIIISDDESSTTHHSSSSPLTSVASSDTPAVSPPTTPPHSTSLAPPPEPVHEPTEEEPEEEEHEEEEPEEEDPEEEDPEEESEEEDCDTDMGTQGFTATETPPSNPSTEEPARAEGAVGSPMPTPPIAPANPHTSSPPIGPDGLPRVPSFRTYVMPGGCRMAYTPRKRVIIPRKRKTPELPTIPEEPTRDPSPTPAPKRMCAARRWGWVSPQLRDWADAEGVPAHPPGGPSTSSHPFPTIDETPERVSVILTAQCAKYEYEIDELKDTLEASAERVGELEGQLKTMGENLAQERQAREDLTGRIAALGLQQQAQTERTQAVEQQINTMGQRLSSTEQLTQFNSAMVYLCWYLFSIAVQLSLLSRLPH